jgi:outer membrane immunogenic protein
MFMPNWSVKAEASYWNLGNMNVRTTVVGSAANNYGNGTTNVNFQGVKAVAGINYHFNFGATPVVAKF